MIKKRSRQRWGEYRELKELTTLINKETRINLTLTLIKVSLLGIFIISLINILLIDHL